ncbi:MAG: hypothetical protein V3R16_06240, partial [Nitrospirales bacterium]
GILLLHDLAYEKRMVDAGDLCQVAMALLRCEPQPFPNTRTKTRAEMPEQGAGNGHLPHSDLVAL